MSSSYRVYIDESGDEGFMFLPNEQGSSRWLMLSALVFRRENDLLTVELAKQARELLKKPPKHPLHFRELKHEQRVPLARLIGQVQARTVSVLIHKPSIPEPEIFQQQKYSLYRYACRLLLERVSWLCRDHQREGHGNGRAELIFSNRSAMSYDDLRNYLHQLKDDAAVRIPWNVVDPDLVRAINHDQLAGLQLADAVATSVFYAVHKNQYNEVEERYLKLIAPIIYQHEGRIMSADSFRDFVLEQLATLPGLRCKRMFGGHGLYCGEQFFGIVHDGKLYFKTNPDTLADYLRHQAAVFAPSEKQVLKNYREVPVEILEDARELTIWAMKAARP